MIATLGWLALGLIIVTAVIVGLCQAAADGDRDLLAPHPDEEPELADVLHFDCERRRRRRSDTRNGLGGAA